MDVIMLSRASMARSIHVKKSTQKKIQIASEHIMDAIGTVYEFGPFRLDPKNRQLLRVGEPIALTPKVFDALVVLVESRGRLVLKDDILKAVWPDTFVTESNLTQVVFTLRKALGERGGERHYIVTIPKRGYRFGAHIQQIEREDPPPPQPTLAGEAPVNAVQPGTARPRRRRLTSAAAVIGITAVLGALHASRATCPASGRVSTIELTDLLALQEAIAGEVAAEISRTVGGGSPLPAGPGRTRSKPASIGPTTCT